MELSKSFLQQKATEYQEAATKIHKDNVERLNAFDSTSLIINPEWKEDIMLSDDYRYLNAIQAYCEVMEMLKFAK
jgi:hypothetical protein